MQENKFWKKGLIILLIFQAIIALSLAIFILVSFADLLHQFGVKYQPDMGILQFIMFYNLILSASISSLSVLWIRKSNLAGIQLGTILGLLLFMVSFAIFLKFNRVDILLFDSLRALLMVIFGSLAYKEQQKYQLVA